MFSGKLNLAFQAAVEVERRSARNRFCPLEQVAVIAEIKNNNLKMRRGQAS